MSSCQTVDHGPNPTPQPGAGAHGTGLSERDLRDAAAMMDRPVPAVKHEFPPEQGEQVKGAETAPERPN